jgi:ABC-type glutathione transport system ATPase component
VEALLRVEDLQLHFRTAAGTVRAVDGVHLEVGRGRTVAVLGESGCGKTSLARALLRLLPRNVAHYSGRVVLDGQDLMALSEERFRQEVRWVRLSLVPQAAMNSLNPVLRVGGTRWRSPCGCTAGSAPRHRRGPTWRRPCAA